MTTIIYIFFVALLSAFFLTPLVRRIALRFGIVDHPSERKLHQQPVARIGGLAIFLSFIISFVFFSFNQQMFQDMLGAEEKILFFVIGAILIFGLGLWDDIKRLPPLVKFAGQILVAVIVYLGGISIHLVSLPFFDAVSLGVFSLPVTVFWFVLVINAINLIDGLDGLAAGVSLFVSITMLFICVSDNRLREAVAFAALAGTLIGFLKYNFNPAVIFMGDSGSYFLGYALAGLSIMGSIKGQVATAMLIPVIVLGIPLMDTLWAPVRRFALGKKMFQPDTGHLHHKLIRLGYSQRRAVLILYGVTILLGAAAIIVVHAKDEMAALVFLVLATAGIYFVHFFRFRRYPDSYGFFNWLNEIFDATGISHDRRSFLNHQLLVARAESVMELWNNISDALQALEIDHAELMLHAGFIPPEEELIPAAGDNNGGQQEGSDRTLHLTWNTFGERLNGWLMKESLLKIELPLLDNEGQEVRHFGILILLKDVDNKPTSHFMLTRIEQLRQSAITALKRLAQTQAVPR